MGGGTLKHSATLGVWQIIDQLSIQLNSTKILDTVKEENKNHALTIENEEYRLLFQERRIEICLNLNV